ncbi:hypothetical protein NDU88_001894 [Pleurodeles waltl]|uniref:Uncharacterized protein n=1 Tax=Pleurodeles waltl TaxID=8319 RepID=A0AAV7M6K9_PLEWA|nr:hypothetical protein NDU88_001894 [Pleurodeles waltl]
MLASSHPSRFSTGDGHDSLYPDALFSLEKAPAYAPVGAKHMLADPVVFSLDPFTDASYFENILFSSYKINE